MHYNGCNYISILGLKLNHVSKRGHWPLFPQYHTYVDTCELCSVSFVILLSNWYVQPVYKISHNVNMCINVGLISHAIDLSISWEMMTSPNGNIFRVTGPVNSLHKGQWLTHLPLVPPISISWSDGLWFRWWLVAYSAPSHYMNPCWVIVNWTHRNKHLVEIWINVNTRPLTIFNRSNAYQQECVSF